MENKSLLELYNKIKELRKKKDDMSKKYREKLDSLEDDWILANSISSHLEQKHNFKIERKTTIQLYAENSLSPHSHPIDDSYLALIYDTAINYIKTTLEKIDKHLNE